MQGTLRWRPVPNFTVYNVTVTDLEQYNPDNTRKIPTHRFPYINGTSFTFGVVMPKVSSGLWGGSKYQWTVEVANISGAGAAIGYFQTPGPARVAPFGPGAARDPIASPFPTLTEAHINLTWAAAPGADVYSVAIVDWTLSNNTNRSFVTNSSGDYSPGPLTYYNIAIDKLHPGHTYCWSVTAYDLSGKDAPGVTGVDIGFWSPQSQPLCFIFSPAISPVLQYAVVGSITVALLVYVLMSWRGSKWESFNETQKVIDRYFTIGLFAAFSLWAVINQVRESLWGGIVMLILTWSITGVFGWQLWRIARPHTKSRT